MGKMESYYFASEDVKWWSHFEKQGDVFFLKKLNMELPYDLQFHP